MVKYFKTVSVVGALILAAGAASAATLTQTIDLEGNGGVAPAFSFGTGDLGVSVNAYIHEMGMIGDPINLVQSSTGLGAIYSGDASDKVDGSGGDEIVLFSFDREVTLEQFSIYHFDTSDDFEVAIYAPQSLGGVLKSYMSDVNETAQLCSGACNGAKNDLGTIEFDPGLVGYSFGIGADEGGDQFKLKSITVSYTSVPSVPLPAAGWMLIASLAGLAWAGQRRGV